MKVAMILKNANVCCSKPEESEGNEHREGEAGGRVWG